MKRIPAPFYSRICGALPILCVDVMLVGPDGHYLLVKRKNEPLKGAYWVPGGRVHRGEDPLKAVVRIVKEETGLPVYGTGFRGYYHEVFKKSAAAKGGIHTVSLVFIAFTRRRAAVLDFQSSAYKWSQALPWRFVRNLKTH